MTDSGPEHIENADRRESSPGAASGLAGSARTPAGGLRFGVFLLLIAASIVLFWPQLRLLFQYMSHYRSDRMPYSYCLVIPGLSAVLLALERKRVFAKVHYDVRTGVILLLLGLAVAWLSGKFLKAIGNHNSTAVAVLGLVIFWLGAFVLCFGSQALGKGKFALGFLFLTVPPPPWLLGPILGAVQHGSADVASWGFTIFGVPVFRNGLYFSLPGLTIEVARECSGIHSTMALLAVSLLAGHLSLLPNWRRVILVAVVFPIVCFTNGLRIAILTIVSNYWDPQFMYGRLHREGGVLFFLLGMVLLMLALHWIGKERRPRQAGQ